MDAELESFKSRIDLRAYAAARCQRRHKLPALLPVLSLEKSPGDSTKHTNAVARRAYADGARPGIAR